MAIEETLEAQEILIRLEKGKVKGAHLIEETVYWKNGKEIHRVLGHAQPLSTLPQDKHEKILDDVLGQIVAAVLAERDEQVVATEAAVSVAENLRRELEFIKSERDYYADVLARASKKAEEALNVQDV